MPIYTTEWYHTTYGVISLYIPEEDLYFDIEMESWTSGGAGGGFSYTRTSTAGGAGNMMTYTPSENFNGTDSFTFSVSDGTLLDTATVSVTVTSVADAPVASDDSVSTDEDTQYSGTLSASDGDDDALTYSVVTDPSNGTLSITNTSTGDYTYDPTANYHGSDSFTFSASDGALSDTSTVVVTINSVNDAPVASDMEVVTDEDNPVSDTLSVSDVEGNTLSYSIASDPLYGTVELDQGSSALSFDGNDEVKITGTGFILGNEPRSISVWAYGSSGNIVSLGDGAGTSNQRFSILISGNRVLIIGESNDWSPNYYLPEDTLTHLVVTHDGSNLKLYANGELIEQTTKTYNTDAHMPIMIGTNTDDRNDEYFNGVIDLSLIHI